VSCPAAVVHLALDVECAIGVFPLDNRPAAISVAFVLFTAIPLILTLVRATLGLATVCLAEHCVWCDSPAGTSSYSTPVIGTKVEAEISRDGIMTGFVLRVQELASGLGTVWNRTLRVGGADRIMRRFLVVAALFCHEMTAGMCLAVGRGYRLRAGRVSVVVVSSGRRTAAPWR